MYSSEQSCGFAASDRQAQAPKPVGIEIIPKAPTAVVSNIVRTSVGNAIVAVRTAVCNAIVAVVELMAVNIAQREYSKGTPSTIM